MTITLNYKSTYYYLVDSGNGLLAFDAGWPDTYREYKECLKREGYRIDDIKWLIVSHFHMDHAGIAGMLADKGIEFYVFPNQLYGLDEMEDLITRKSIPYHPVDREKIRVIEIHDSRQLLKSINIDGEVLHTNGHGEQCVSLLLDSGEAFIGDLAPESMIADDDIASKNNWSDLRSRGAKYIKHAHAGEFILDS